MNVAQHDFIDLQRSIARLLSRAMTCCVLLVCNLVMSYAQIDYEIPKPRHAPVLVWKPNPQCSEVLPDKEIMHPFLGDSLVMVFPRRGGVTVVDLDGQVAPVTINLSFEPVWGIKYPNSPKILVMGPDTSESIDAASTLWYIDVVSSDTLWKYRCDDSLIAMAISNDGEMLALGFSVYEYREQEDSLLTGGWIHRSWIELIDIDRGERTDTLKCSGFTCISCMTFSHDGSMLAVGETTQCGLSWWDLSSNTEHVLLRRVNHGEGMDGIHSVAFSPDDNFLIAAGALHNGVAEETMYGAGLLLGWNTTDDRLAMVETSPDSCFRGICFDREGRFFVTSEQAVSGEFKAWPPEWETIFKLWSLEYKSIMVECRREGEHMLAPVTTDDRKMITLSVDPVKQAEDQADIPLYKIPVRVKRCDWNLEIDDLFN